MTSVTLKIDGSELRIMPISGELMEAKAYDRTPDGKSVPSDRPRLMPDGRMAYTLREAKIAWGENILGVARVMTATQTLPNAADAFTAVFSGSGRATVTFGGTPDPWGLSVNVEVAEIIGQGTTGRKES